MVNGFSRAGQLKMFGKSYDKSVLFGEHTYEWSTWFSRKTQRSLKTWLVSDDRRLFRVTKTTKGIVPDDHYVLT